MSPPHHSRRVRRLVARVRQMRRRGWSHARIAREIGLATGTVSNMARGVAKYAGIPNPPPLLPRRRDATATVTQVRRVRERRRAGVGFREIAALEGIHEVTAWEMARGHGRYARVTDPPPIGRWAIDRARWGRQVARVRELTKEGATTASIAQELGLSPTTVRDMAIGRRQYAAIKEPPPHPRRRTRSR